MAMTGAIQCYVAGGWSFTDIPGSLVGMAGALCSVRRPLQRGLRPFLLVSPSVIDLFFQERGSESCQSQGWGQGNGAGSLLSYATGQSSHRTYPYSRDGDTIQSLEDRPIRGIEAIINVP